ncbi:MAG: hypothetical protein GXO00_01175 [Candidatus Diapherotrites archaeon]|nr:hypothetical protein [Candidatus Diapherotrites archaeon]
MPRRPVFDVVKKVFSVLSEEPKTILDVSREAGVSWEGAKRVLELLEELGFVVKTPSGYRLVKKGTPGSEETYFKVYIDPERKKRAQALLYLVSRTWKELVGTEPGPLFVQKIAVEVARDLNLDVPVLRYKYSMFIPVDPAPVDHDFGEEVKQRVRTLIKEVSSMNIREFINFVYSRYDDRIFSLKEQILAKLFRGEVDESLESSLWELMVELDDRELREYVARYLGLIQPFLGNAPPELIPLFRMLFEALWDYTATKLFWIDYTRYYPDVLPVNLAANLVASKQFLEDLFSDVTTIVDSIVEKKLDTLQRSP